MTRTPPGLPPFQFSQSRLRGGFLFCERRERQSELWIRQLYGRSQSRIQMGFCIAFKALERYRPTEVARHFFNFAFFDPNRRQGIRHTATRWPSSRALRRCNRQSSRPSPVLQLPSGNRLEAKSTEVGYASVSSVVARTVAGTSKTCKPTKEHTAREAVFRN